MENTPDENTSNETTNTEAPPPVEDTATPQASELTKDDKLFGMLCHLTALAGFILPIAGVVLGPLVIWMIKKNEMPFADDQGKEALNFNITMLIAGFVSFLLVAVAIGAILLPVVVIYWLIYTIIASMKANEGVYYRYPIAIRFIK
jgi:uncharacterized Tic20 family protein